jgi:sugar-specific transcriptional regulator TrmB
MINSLPLQTRQTLKSLGFSENECRVLLPLFAQKKLSAKDISQQTTLSFDTVHYVLHALQKKGLLRRTSLNGDDVVEICSDEDFLTWIDNQKRVNAGIYDDAKGVLQAFLTLLGESSWKPNVIYFEGAQGIIDIYEDILRQGKDVYGWTDIKKIHETIGKYMDQFIRKRMAKGIASYAIMPVNAMNTSYAKKNQMRHNKFSRELNINGEIRIYGDKVAVITFHDEKPVGFVFSGSVITAIFKGIFDHAWKTCASVKH